MAAGMLISVPSAQADHAWGTYHWERKAALILTVGDCHTPSLQSWSSLLGALSPSSGSVVANWDTFSGQYLAVVGGNCSAGQIKSYNANYGDTGWLGVASVGVAPNKGGHITSGTSRMNEYYAGYGDFDEPIEWKHVLCQEIGHLFGLDHNRDGAYGGTPDETCMNDAHRPLRYPTPNSHDTEQLDLLYAHTHTTSGGGGGGSKCNPVKGCATAMHAIWAERYDNDDAMFAASDAVIEATVLSSAFDRDVGGNGERAVPVTRVVLQVTNSYRGATKPVIILEQTRGPDFEIEDDPGYVSGDRYFLYLRKIGANAYRVVNPDGRVRR